MLLINSWGTKTKQYYAFSCYSLRYFAVGHVTLYLCNANSEEQVDDSI